MSSRNKPPQVSKAKASGRAASAAKPRPAASPEPIRTPQQLRAEIGRPKERAPSAQPGPTTPVKKSAEPLWVWPALIAVLLMAFLLRIYGINFGLPHQYHGDETIVVTNAIRGWGGDAQIFASPYPALYTRFLSAVCGLPLLFGRLNGQYPGVGRFVLAYYLDPTRVMLWARLATAALGTLAVLLTFLVGRRFWGERVGLAGALLLAVSAQHGAHSHFAVADVPQSVLILAAYFPLYNALTRGQRRDYVLAGLWIGLGAATGYFAALLLPCLPLAALLQNRETKARAQENANSLLPQDTDPPTTQINIKINTRRNLLLGLFAAAGGFCVATPNTIASLPASLARCQAGLAAAFPGNGSNGVSYTLRQALMGDWGVPVLFAALAGIALLLRKRKSEELLFVAFPISYTLALAVLAANAGRLLTGLDPFIALLASVALCRLYDAVRGRLAKRNRPAPAWKLVWTGGVLLVAAPPFWTLLQWDSLVGNTPDTRAQALKWADQNIPDTSPDSKACIQAPHVTGFDHTYVDAAKHVWTLPPEWGANVPLLTYPKLQRVVMELTSTRYTSLWSDAVSAIHTTHSEAPWTWPPPDDTALRRGDVGYIFTSDACGPLPAGWLRHIEAQARGGVLHFTPGSVAAQLPPGLPGLPPRITIYALRDPARP